MDGHRYYFTIVTHQRKPILIDNIEILRESFAESKQYFNYKIDAIVIYKVKEEKIRVFEKMI